jgi:predicted Ser/Thr protein kinase
MDIPSGWTVGGYRILRKLGSGGTGTVYVARHRTLPRDVAVKVLHPAFSTVPQFRERFEHEADVVARLDHRNVVDVLDKGQDGDRLYIVMQYVDGPNLEQVLREHGAFAPDRAVALIAAVGDAVQHAHQAGLLHRDVKPANILLRRDGGEPMLTDFGIAKDLAAASPLTRHGEALYTPGYAAPEQIDGRPVDVRADVYSLGVVLFELLTGRRAFPQETPMQVLAAMATQPAPDPLGVRPDLPPALARVVTRALSTSPDERFGSCAAFVAAVRDALVPEPAAPPTIIPADSAATPPAPSAPEPARSQTAAPPQRRRSRAPLWIAVGALVAVLAVVLGIVVASGGGDGDVGAQAGGTTTGSSPSAAADPSSGPAVAAGLAPGDCVDDGATAVPCDGPHAAEVYSAGECTDAALVGYLGGTPGEDPLTSLLTRGTATTSDGAVCIVAGPEPTASGPAQGVLASSAGGVWRRCMDDRGSDVLCTQPHTTEIVFDRSEAADPGTPLACEQRAGSFLGKPYVQVADDLQSHDDGTHCLLTVRGHNVLTGSLHGLRSNALPIEADGD